MLLSLRSHSLVQMNQGSSDYRIRHFSATLKNSLTCCNELINFDFVVEESTD